ncbi:MAG TPA: hypothetical protein DEB48_11610 [Verrucomicrobiales bacterium]|nr:hypothetical protein [Verrucomicrobiales bacterium]
MQCPACSQQMEPVVFQKCGQCQGSYFDAGEFSDLAGA